MKLDPPAALRRDLPAVAARLRVALATSQPTLAAQWLNLADGLAQSFGMDVSLLLVAPESTLGVASFQGREFDVVIALDARSIPIDDELAPRSVAIFEETLCEADVDALVRNMNRRVPVVLRADADQTFLMTRLGRAGTTYVARTDVTDDNRRTASLVRRMCWIVVDRWRDSNSLAYRRKLANSMKFYGQFQAPQDRLLFEHYFCHRDAPGRYLESGAVDGVSESSGLFFEETLGWSAVNVEPVPASFELLRRNRPRSLNIDAALSNQVGWTTFTQAYHPQHPVFGNGSIRHSEAHRTDLLQQGCTFEEFRVRTTTFAQLVREHAIDSLDLMILDVEGHELEVVEGMREAPRASLPTLLCIEYANTNMQALRLLLSEWGFVEDRAIHNNLIFVRSRGIG